MNAGWRLSSFYFFASRVLGEQNEEQATRIRQVSPWHPSLGSDEESEILAIHARLVSSGRPTQTSQLDGSVDEVNVVVVQDIPTAFLCKGLF